jgi:hypothetical protein
MTETEHERKVVEYWAKTRRFSIYDIGSNFKNTDDLTLPYEPTAVLTSTSTKLVVLVVNENTLSTSSQTNNNDSD